MQQGSYVLCVNDINWDSMAYVRMTSLPEKNHIYVVRRIIPKINESCDDDGIALEGIFSDWGFFTSFKNERVYEEYSFRKSRFLKIIPPEQFVEMILETLEPEYTEFI